MPHRLLDQIYSNSDGIGYRPRRLFTKIGGHVSTNQEICVWKIGLDFLILFGFLKKDKKSYFKCVKRIIRRLNCLWFCLFYALSTLLQVLLWLMKKMSALLNLKILTVWINNFFSFFSSFLQTSFVFFKLLLLKFGDLKKLHIWLPGNSGNKSLWKSGFKNKLGY